MRILFYFWYVCEQFLLKDKILFREMNILTENLTYKTQLPENQVIERLQDCIAPKKDFSLFDMYNNTANGKLYEGKISGQTFEVSRIINYRNSFLPIITGNITQENNATIIKINMRLHMFVSAFLVIWCTGFAGSMIFMLSKDVDFTFFDVMPFVMLVIFFRVFKFETNKSKKDFQQLFEAEIIEEK